MCMVPKAWIRSLRKVSETSRRSLHKHNRQGSTPGETRKFWIKPLKETDQAKRYQNQKFTPLSETTRIPASFICEFAPAMVTCDHKLFTNEWIRVTEFIHQSKWQRADAQDVSFTNLLWGLAWLVLSRHMWLAFSLALAFSRQVYGEKTWDINKTTHVIM